LYLIHNVLPHEEKLYDRWLAKGALGTGDHFIVQSTRENERLTDLLPSARATCVPHPAFDFFEGRNLSREEAKIKLDVDPDLPMILFFGFVRPYKGLLTLLEAVRLLREWGKLVSLVIAGEFWEVETKYFRYISKHKLDEYVSIDNRYIPNEEVGTFFTAADLFAAPHTRGTQSGALTIASSYNLPIVATSAIVGVEKENANVKIKIVPPSDPHALAHAILGIINEAQSGSDEKVDRSSNISGWNEMVKTIESLVVDKRS
jgi:D-inositol-3-phosphate glycosyltransferase